MNTSVYTERRARLAKAIGEGRHIYLLGAKEVIRNGDVHFPFRQYSDFYYLTGFTEPDASLVITGGNSPRSILFCSPKNTDQKADMSDTTKVPWVSECMGGLHACHKFQFDEGYENATRTIDAFLQNLEKESESFLGNLAHIIGEMRIIKDTIEIGLMRKAAEISARAHRDLLSFVRPEMCEYAVDAKLTQHFRNANTVHAYAPIVASGKNALTLHYAKNNRRMKDGELLIVDAGCEYREYASDITRTIPVSGKFSKPQRTIYGLVLSAQMEAIDMVRVGTPIHRVHEKACEVITDGLLQLGFIRASSLDVALMKKLYKPFFPHGTSHFLGIDVHDAGDYKRDAETKMSHRILEAGMVITIEPGIYIRPSPTVPREYWDIGIRIEDDVLVTMMGPSVLSKGAPKDPDEIEDCMRLASRKKQ